MAIQTKAATISDGDQLNFGYFNDSGNTIKIEAGENITAGNIVYIKLNDGKVYMSDTGTADDIRADGIALNTANSGADVNVQFKGPYQTTGLTDKTAYYLGAAGALSTTASAIKMGMALSTTELYLNIVQDDKDVVGTIKAYQADFTGIPSNNLNAFWKFCDGSAISDAESPFNGENLPTLNGGGGATEERFLYGDTASDQTKTESYLPGHTHTYNAGTTPGAAGGTTGSTTAGTAWEGYSTRWIMKIK